MKPIFPPKPKGKVPPSELRHLERTGQWIVQRKFNGDRTVIHRATDGVISLFSRYGKKFDRYRMSSELRSELSSLNFQKNEEYWLDGELLNEHYRHTVILFDVLHAGHYLFGVAQEDRLDTLKDICGHPSELFDPPIALVVSPHVLMAETWDKEFTARFKESLDLDAIEGLVLRKKRSVLDNHGSAEYSVDWQVRCRKPGPTYAL